MAVIDAKTTYQFDAETGGLLAALKQVRGEIARTGADAQKTAERIDGNLATLTKLGLGLGVVLPVVQNVGGAVLRMADSVTVMRNQLRQSTTSAAEAAVAQDRLFQISQRAAVATGDLADVYSQIARASQNAGISQQRQLVITEAIANAMASGTGSAAAMQAALVQLSQGLGSGVLRGEELNSIMEQAQPLARALAAGLGVTTAELRRMGEAGELTTERVLLAIEKGAPQLAKVVAESERTASQSFTVLGNAATRFVGQADQATGASRNLASAVTAVAGAITSMGDALERNKDKVDLIAGGLGGAAVAAGVLATAAAIATLRVRVIALGATLAAHPGVLLLLGIGAAVGAVASGYADPSNRVRMLTGNIEKLTQRLDELNKLPDGPERDRKILQATNARTRLIAERAGLGYSPDESAQTDFRRLELGTNETTEAAAEAQRARLGKLTRDRQDFMKSYATDGEKLAAEIKKYDEQFKGKVTPEQRAADLAKIRADFAKKKGGNQNSDPLAEADQRIRDAFDAWRARDSDLEQQREDELQQLLADGEQRRLNAAIDTAAQLRETNKALTVDLIQDDEKRGLAAIDLERRVMAERIAAFKEGSDERKQAEADLAEYVTLRQQQLGEQLKPTWQRMLDDWQDTMGGMKRFSDQFMTGFLERGRDTWMEWATSGKLTTKGLTDFIKQEFARLMYERFLAQATANAGNALLNGIIKGVGAVVSGIKYSGTSTDPSAANYENEMDRGHLATGTNYIPYDGFKATLHEGEAVVPKKYNPAAGGASAAERQGPSIVLSPTINVGEGVTRGEVFQAVRNANAELLQMLQRSRRHEGAYA